MGEMVSGLCNKCAHRAHVDDVCQDSSVVDACGCTDFATRPRSTATLSILVPQSLVLNSNQRRHRMAHAKIAAHLRVLGAAESRGIRPMNRAHLTVRVGWPDKRRRDVGNIYPTLKPLIDGMVDSGLLPDDDDTHLTGPDLRPEHAGATGFVRFTFAFEELA